MKVKLPCEGQRGLSLVEVLVAVAVSGIVIVALVQVLSQVTSGQRRIGSKVEGAAAISEIANTLMEAVPYRLPDSYNLPGVGLNAGLQVSAQAVTVRRLATKGYEKIRVETQCRPLEGGGFKGLASRLDLAPLAPDAFDQLFAEGYKAACGQTSFDSCGAGAAPFLKLTVSRDSEAGETRRMQMPSSGSGSTQAVAAGLCAVSLSSYELLISFQYAVPSGDKLKLERRDVIYPAGQEDLNSPSRNSNILFLR